MAVTLDDKLVVAISSRALFDFEEENRLFEKGNDAAYVQLQRAAVQLSTEVQRRALQLATILEPLLIVAMGLVVMLIVLAVLLPIIQLNQFVK